MEESKNKNTQNRSSDLPEQLQSSQSNKKISNIDNKENSYSSPRNNIFSPRSKHSSIKEENLSNNDLSNHHSPRSPKIDSLEEQINDLQNNDSDAALPANYSASTNISDINIISDVSGEIIPKNKLLKMFREEHNNKIKKTKRILRDADYRHAQYNSPKKSRSTRSKTRSNPILDSNKAIISSIPESIKQSPENNIGNNENNEVEEEIIKERSVSIGSLGNQDNNKTNSLKSNENNSPKSPKSNKSFSSHVSKFTNDKLSPGQLQGNNSLENIASYNNCSTHSEELSHHHKHHTKRKRKRPHLVLSPVQCNNFFSNSNTTPNNKIKSRSINGNNTNLSPSDGQNFQFTPPSKLNSNGSKAKNDNNMKNNKANLETHFSSNLMHNSSIDFETVNAAPDELNSSSSFATVQAVDKGSSLLAVERGIGFPIKDSSLSEVSLNFNTESLNFSQSDDFHSDNNSKHTNSFSKESYSNLNSKHGNSNISNPKSKSSHVSIKNNFKIDSNHSNSKIERNRSSSHKSNSIVERNIPQISDKELLNAYSNDESNLYTYTYETIGISDSKSWTYMSIYDYEYEEDEDNNDKIRNESKNYSSNKESEKERSDKHQSYSSIKERELEKGSEKGRSDKHQSYSSIKEREVEKGSEYERSDQNKSHLSSRESEKLQSHSSIKEREVEKGSDKNSRHQSQLSAKESENNKSSKHQSHSSPKGSDIERSRHSEKSQNSQYSNKESENSKKRNDRSFDSKGSSPRSKKHSSSSSEKSTPIKSASNSNKLNSEELLDVKEREINSFDMAPSPRLEEIKRGIQYEIERLKNSPQNIVSSEKVASIPGQFSPRQLNSSKLSNNYSSPNNSEKKESDFHFESENGHQSFHQPLLNNGKRNMNISVHSNSVVSQESFTEIFDKCQTDEQSSSIVQPNMHSNNISSQNSEQMHLSSEKAANISHLSESCDEEPNSIRNISQIPNDVVKRAMPNPSKDMIISLSESENENENEDDFKNDKTEQSLSLASSENASQFLSTSSSSASPSPSKKREVKLVRKSSSKGKISHDIRSFSINDIEKIIKKEEEEEVIEVINNPSSTSSIKPRKIDFTSNTASSSYSSGQKSIQKRTQDRNQQPQSPNQRNRQISPLNSPSSLKSKETENPKKPIFPAFDLPSSSSASLQAHSSHSFSSLGRMVLDGEEEEESFRSGSRDILNTSDTSSLLNSPSISPFNTLRITIVEVKTEVEISDVSVHMFILSDPRNVAETEVSKVKSNRHVFRETFNVSLDGLTEKVDTENSMNSESLIDENIIGDLCVVVRHQREVVARATIPISSVTFKIGKKVDRWYMLVPNGQIRMIALAVNQENRTATATPTPSSSSSIISSGSKINQNSNFEIVLDKSYKNPNLGDSNGSFELNQGEIYTNPNLGESPKKIKKKSKKNLNLIESSGPNSSVDMKKSKLDIGSSNNEVDEIELDVDVDVVVGRESGSEKNKKK